MAGLGDVLGGRYRLVELLGQGGMATIYRATDSELGRDVAVKVLHPEYGRDPDFVARFRQEAHAAAALSHPGIVAVHDFGVDEGGPYLVMELVDGEDLAALLKRNGPLPPRQAARLVAEVARALDAAHDRGIVHRDVKPANIMLNAKGRVKVTDFGIARAWADAGLTLPGTTLGSVHYFSPEQALGEPATAASDVYSLGIVLYELLSGRRPWEGDSAAAVAMARISAPPPASPTFGRAFRPHSKRSIAGRSPRRRRRDMRARAPWPTRSRRSSRRAGSRRSASQVRALRVSSGAPGPLAWPLPALGPAGWLPVPPAGFPPPPPGLPARARSEAPPRRPPAGFRPRTTHRPMPTGGPTTAAAVRECPRRPGPMTTTAA